MNVMYLVRYKAVQRSNWSRVRGLHLAQVGQQWQLSLLVAALVFPVRHHPSQKMMHQGTFLAVKVKTDWWSGVLTLFLDAPLPGTLTVQRGECNSLEGCGSLWTHPEPSGQVGAFGSHVLFSETQVWERDNGWYRCDRAGRHVTLGRSESCPPAAEIQTLRTARDKHWFRHCLSSLSSVSVIEWSLSWPLTQPMVLIMTGVSLLWERLRHKNLRDSRYRSKSDSQDDWP